MKLSTIVLLFFFAVGLFRVFADAAPASGPKKQVSVQAPVELSSAGSKISLPGGGWFVWRFAQKPKLGTLIVKVQAFTKNGERDTSAKIVGEFGMPSMRDHDSGPVVFRLSKKGDYLLPLEVAMQGQWALVIHVNRGGKEIYAGRVLFSI